MDRLIFIDRSIPLSCITEIYWTDEVEGTVIESFPAVTVFWAESNITQTYSAIRDHKLTRQSFLNYFPEESKQYLGLQ